MAAQRSIVICGGAFAGLALALAFRQGLGADIPVIVADPKNPNRTIIAWEERKGDEVELVCKVIQ